MSSLAKGRGRVPVPTPVDLRHEPGSTIGPLVPDLIRRASRRIRTLAAGAVPQERCSLIDTLDPDILDPMFGIAAFCPAWARQFVGGAVGALTVVLGTWLAYW
jgi:hypothetical protein